MYIGLIRESNPHTFGLVRRVCMSNSNVMAQGDGDGSGRCWHLVLPLALVVTLVFDPLWWG